MAIRTGKDIARVYVIKVAPHDQDPPPPSRLAQQQKKIKEKPPSQPWWSMNSYVIALATVQACYVFLYV